MRLLLGNFKGPEGKQGPEGQKGNTGDTGQRGSRWTSGTNVTGTSTTGTIFASTGITDSLLHDYYINTSTGNLYECTVPGPADVAEWTYICNIKGPTGATGPAGSISDINNQKPTYTVADRLENIESGETVKTAFGKLKKALSLLITHYTQQATATVLGHVKLSNSAAVTQTGLMALDAIEKNASVAGTLANQISQTNSNFENYLPAYFEYVGSAEGIGNSLDIPRGAKELYIVGNTPYYSIPIFLTAGQLTLYESVLGGGNHYIRFSVNRNGSGKIVITDAMQDGSTSNNARIALWYR